MRTATAKLARTLHRVHIDERGMEAIQVVMILAIAAVALIAVKTQWTVISKWFSDLMVQLIGSDNWQG